MPEFIDRDLALEEAKKSYLFFSIKPILEKLPAADVRPVVRGKWEVFDADFNSYSCSACGEPFTLNDGTPRENNMNYCPNCGAKMEES